MWPILVAVLVVAALLAGLVASRAGIYRRLFAPAHYRELAEKLPAARAAAIERVGDAGPIAPDDPRVIRTSAGLAVLVTVRRAGEDYVHHLSVSVAGGYTARPVGEGFAVFVAERLGWDVARAAFGVSQRGVFHGERVLDEAAERAWAERAVETAVDEEVHARAWDRRAAVRFPPMRVPSE